MNSVRREKLREYLEKHNIATISQLSALMPGVSLMTIHRDLNFLQEQGLIQKIRGGARYMGGGASEPAFSAREIVGKSQKQRLSEKAVSLLEGVSSIFIDAGTTMMAFARLLPDCALYIVTTGPNIALELSKKIYPVVDLCGGTLNKLNLTLSGVPALDMISHINIDTAFLAASGYSVKGGFTCGMESEARIKSLVIKRARRAVVLMDSSKLERLLPYTFAELEDVDCLVTELSTDGLPAEIIELAKKANTLII